MPKSFCRAKLNILENVCVRQTGSSMGFATKNEFDKRKI